MTPQGGLEQLFERQDDALLTELQGFILVQVAGNSQGADGKQRERQVTCRPGYMDHQLSRSSLSTSPVLASMSTSHSTFCVSRSSTL
ncbi:hypothetical protein D3C75_1278470 [compost metagenome]